MFRVQYASSLDKFSLFYSLEFLLLAFHKYLFTEIKLESILHIWAEKAVLRGLWKNAFLWSWSFILKIRFPQSIYPKWSCSDVSWKREMGEGWTKAFIMGNIEERGWPLKKGGCVTNYNAVGSCSLQQYSLNGR